MPVHFCQISCQRSGKHQRDIGDGRTVTKLLCTVTSHKITGYQSGRKRNNQYRPHPQHGADGLATYLVIIISFNLPFLMEEYGLSSGRAGILISLFFLAIMAPGFVLNKIVQVLGRRIYMVCLLMIACGMGIILLSRSEILIALGCILNGLSYGIIQPLIYDKTSDVAVPQKVTLALAFVMAMNYVAILLCPFIVDAFQNLFHSHSQTFAFWLNLMVALMGMFIVMKQEKLSL